MKNKLIDLNNYLFMQLERLNDENLEGDQLTAEIERSKAISTVASHIIQNGKLALDAARYQAEYGRIVTPIPKMLESGND